MRLETTNMKEAPNLIVVDAEKLTYSVYIKGKFWHTVKSDRLLDADELEQFRLDPRTYVYGDDPEPTLA